MNQFEKKIVEVDVWEKETNLLVLKDIPKEYLEEGYYLYTRSYDGDITMFIEHHRLETDEEYNKRLETYNLKFKHQQEKEYQEYLKLKAKFEGNGSN